MLSASDEQLLSELGRWYIPRRDPRYLRRNALVAIGNSADPTDGALRATLDLFVDGDDELLRDPAQSALQRFDERAQVQQ